MAERMTAPDEGNNIEQKTTPNEAYTLTPQQEQACLLLASGESYTTTAERLGINRGTLYKWLGIVEFKRYLDRQCALYQDEVKMALLSLHGEAVRALQELMQKGSEATRLKAATWLLDRVSGEGERCNVTAVRELFIKQCTYDWGGSTKFFDEDGYKELLQQCGMRH